VLPEDDTDVKTMKCKSDLKASLTKISDEYGANKLLKRRIVRLIFVLSTKAEQAAQTAERKKLAEKNVAEEDVMRAAKRKRMEEMEDQQNGSGDQQQQRPSPFTRSGANAPVVKYVEPVFAPSTESSKTFVVCFEELTAATTVSSLL
jgi:hypothetical protein